SRHDSTERTGEHPFGLSFQPGFVTTNEPDEGECAAGRAGNQDSADWLRESFHAFTEEVRERSIAARPCDGSGGVEDEESAPRHAVHAGEERRESADDDDEPSKENERAAVAQKQELSKLDARRRHPEQTAGAQQQGIPESLADQKPDVIACDRTNR